MIFGMIRNVGKETQGVESEYFLGILAFRVAQVQSFTDHPVCETNYDESNRERVPNHSLAIVLPGAEYEIADVLFPKVLIFVDQTQDYDHFDEE